LREEVPFETTREGKVLFVDIQKPKKIESQTAPAAEKEMTKEEVQKEEVKDEVKIETRAEIRTEAKAEPKLEPRAEEKKEQEKTSPELKKAAETETVKMAEEDKKASEERAPEKIYSGKKLSLDFKDADIKNILRLIAEVSDLNIITSDDVTGKITMRLVDVPWDQALEIILQAKALGMTRIGNVVRVAPLEVLKKEIQAELEAKRAKEKLEDLVMELIPVNYATGKEIIPQIKGVLSDRGDIRIDERTNTLIVKDIPRNIASMKSLVKSLDTKTPQVLIEARIVEANLTFQKELGVKWGFELGGGTTTLGGGIPGTTLGQPTREIVNLPGIARGGVPGTTGAAGLIEFLFSRGTIKELDIAISAHENKGDARIISSPKIATLDNKEASVEQGLRIPYRKLTTEGTVTTDFIDANLKLTVTPHVTNDGTIKMSIKAKKDAPDQSITVDGVPSIDKKEAITEVLVKDNGVIVIAGVYSIEKNDASEGIPLFNKIPLLGWLFKREVKEDKRRDLLIFISPKIIKDGV
jgi:type IV pilus assembly protein PilQ